jgi:hypothetical protein
MSVWYGPRAAINPEGTQAVTDVPVQFFAVTDTTFSSPLTVEDVSHVPTQTMQVSNYLLPGFWGPDGGIVMAKAGDWKTPVEALEGLRDAAVAAQDAAQELRDSAIIGIVEGDNIHVNNTDPQHPRISFNMDAVVLESNFSKDPSFEYTSGLPSNPNGTIEYNTSIKHSGTRSVKMTNTTGAGPFNPAFQSGASPESMGLENGDQITWSLWVYVPSATTWDPQLRIGGAAVGTAKQGSGYNVPKDTWTKISLSHTVADATSTSLTCYVYGSTTSGEVIYVDDRGLAKGENSVDFSGDTPQDGNDFYRWRGVAGQSVSERFTPGLNVVGVDGTVVEVTESTAYWTFTIDGTDYTVAKPSAGVALADVSGVTDFAKGVLESADDAEEFRDAIGAGTGTGTGSVASADITDATTIGKAAITAENAAALTALLSAATATTKGIVELATTAEATAGTDTTRAVTPAGLAAAVAAKTVSLASIPAGMSFRIVYDGTNWKYNGATISARPTARTDVYMVCYNPVDATVPSFALAGVDVLERAL